MKTWKLKGFKTWFLYLSFSLITLLYVAVTLVPFLSSGDWWFIAVLGLIFPYLLVLELIFLIILIIKKSKLALIPMLAILLSWQQISVIFAINRENDDIAFTQQGSLRILSWNVAQWNMDGTNRSDWEVYRNLMFDFIQSQGPDILCLQEFFESKDSTIYSSTLKALKDMGYTSQYFFPTFKNYLENFQFGLVILSRFPIIDAKGYFEYAGGHSEGFCYADIKTGKETVRVFNFHTESPGIHKQIGFNETRTDYAIGLFRKIRQGYMLRNLQVKYMKSIVDQSPYKSIICGDLGDVPNSFAYFHLKQGLQDAFLEKGNGFGRTYRYKSPTLRIDYLFFDKMIKITNFSLPQVIYSDHYPIISDFEL